jgi:cbb3-type cytochrome oxidase maturation protein
MSTLVFLVPLALILGGVALVAFLWSLRSGQYDDLDGAAERIFLDDIADRSGAEGAPSGHSAERSDST